MMDEKVLLPWDNNHIEENIHISEGRILRFRERTMRPFEVRLRTDVSNWTFTNEDIRLIATSLLALAHKLETKGG